jgi:hypothetical protein
MSEGKIGDVKYSLSEPIQFNQQNGEAWVLMDGRNIAGSKLAALTKQEILPDARGVFIRTLNLTRDDDHGDADNNRKVGSFQWDLLRDHTHKYNKPNDHGSKIKYGGPNDSEFVNDKQNFETGIVTNETNDAQRPRAGIETRPKNIALYTYVKINDR